MKTGSLEARVRGVVFCLALFFSSTLGVLFMIGPILPLMIISPARFASVVDTMLAIWFYFVSSLLERFLGIHIVVTGDELRPDEGSLFVLNHRTRMDWMYLWPVLARQPVGLRTIKIVLKDMLKNIPGAGWAMQLGSFIFVKRKWEEDKLILSSMLEYYARTNRKPQIVLFPEGTDLTATTKCRSNEFAKQHDLPVYDYVLHPRTTGFTHLTNEMRKCDLLQSVYDISIAYPSEIPTTEAQLLGGILPTAVHFHIKRYHQAALPQDQEALSKWCVQRWAEKEKRLQQFYVDKQFVSTDHECHSSLSLSATNALNGRTNNVAEVDNDSPTTSVAATSGGRVDSSEQNNNGHCMPSFLYTVATSYMCTYMILILALLYMSWLAQLFALCQVIFYTYMTKRGGLQLFQAQYDAPNHCNTNQKLS